MNVHVPTCFLLCGSGALLGLGLMALVRTDEPGVRASVAQYKLALALLSGMALQALVPAPWNAWALKVAIGAAAMGVAVLGLAFRELNGRRTPRFVATAAVALIGVMVLAAAPLDDRAYEFAAAGTFLVIGLAVCIDQAWLIVTRPRVRIGEIVLLGVAIVFTATWVLSLHHWWTSTEPIPPHWIYAPAWLVPWSALAYAVLPLSVASVALAIINDRLMRALHARALSDELTGVLSRRGLRELGEQMLERRGAKRAPQMLAVLMLDVDHFKSINDRYGHLVGDEVLRHVADVVQANLRPDSLLARYGGEEFTVLLPLHHEDEAIAVAERLRQAVERTPYTCTKNGPIFVSISVGLAFHRLREPLEAALERADERLYVAKQTGRNRVVAATV